MSNYNNPNSHNDSNDWLSSNNNTHPGQGHGNVSLPSSYSSLGQAPAPPPYASLGNGGTDGYSYVSYPGSQTMTNAYEASQSTTANNTSMAHPSTHNTNNQGGFTYAYAAMGQSTTANNTNMTHPSIHTANNQGDFTTSRWGPPPQQYPQQYYQQQHPQYQNQQQQQQYNAQTYNQQYVNYPPSHAQHTKRIDTSLPLPPPPPPPNPSNINKLKRTNLDNGQQQGTKEAAVSSKKPPQPPPPQKDQTDDAVNAIGALSNLQHRWSAPTSKRKRKEGAAEEIPNTSIPNNPTKRKRKRQRRRNKKKKKVGTSMDNPIIIRDDDNNEWIDVDHSESSSTQMRKQQPQQEVNFTVCNFPPLESTAKSEESTAAESSMKDMSTTQLKSYASVLGRALAIDDNAKEQQAKKKENEVIELLDDSDDDEEDDEMDISDDDDSQQQEDDINPAQKQEICDQEQLSLKLAELKAKAKLARAKLRIAEQKKAKGTRESLDSSARSNSTTSGNAKTPPPLSPSHTSTSTSPLPPMLANITALRNIVGSLVIENVSLTGPSHEVRFVNSVYSHIRDDDDDDDDTNNQGTASDDTKKKMSLNHKLQLMKLQLEIKKKELEKKELEKRRRKMMDENTIELKPPPEQDESATKETETRSQSPSDEGEKGENTLKKQDLSVDAISDEQKLEQLRNRQKELKQKNDIANLRNLIHRQRDLLQAQGKELTESSTQLQQCVDGIKTKQELLEVSNKKLIDMNNRKRRLESMVLQATEQVVAARKALSERRQLGS